jgi:hypothetical protein
MASAKVPQRSVDTSITNMERTTPMESRPLEKRVESSDTLSRQSVMRSQQRPSYRLSQSHSHSTSSASPAMYLRGADDFRFDNQEPAAVSNPSSETRTMHDF